MRKWETLTCVPSLQDHLKRGLAPKHPKKTSSSIRSFLRLLLSVGAARREKNPSSLDRDIGLVLRLPLSLLIHPHPLVIEVQQDREKSSSGERRGEDSQWQCRRPVTGYQFLRWSRGDRIHACVHACYAPTHWCTPTRNGITHARRRCVLREDNLVALSRFRVYALTHARIYEWVGRATRCMRCVQRMHSRRERLHWRRGQPIGLSGDEFTPPGSHAELLRGEQFALKISSRWFFFLFFSFSSLFRLSSPFPSLLFSSLDFPSRSPVRQVVRSRFLPSSPLSTSCSVWLGRRSCSRRRSKRDRK